MRIGGISKLLTPAYLRLTCYASGTVERYEWYRSGSRLPSTVSDYSKSSVQLSDSGSYQCKACNWAGCTSSSSRTVTVIGWLMRMVNHGVNSMVKPLPVYQCVLCVHGVFGILLSDVMKHSSIMCMKWCACMNELCVYYYYHQH